jgi:hypothetical protein
MKRACIVFALLLAVVVSSEAQIVKSIALKAGIAWATQDWKFQNISGTTDYDYRMGIHTGVNVEFMQHPFLSVVTELGYTPKGYRTIYEHSTENQPEGTGEMTEEKFTCHYLYASPMLKARLEFGGFVPYIFLGPRLDLYLSNEVEEGVFFVGLPEEDMKTMVFGMNYGLGLEYVIGRVGFALIFSQQYDFTNAFAIEELNIGPESIKNNAFVLDLGIKYYFGKH